ncbi:hypothetical protein H9P43_003534 [Blastocladiella emersonii ATCC 22665]|nr:hypothetical protein H9P43_003534 [Blastocladiella emersonii ATCC 22665]
MHLLSALIELATTDHDPVPLRVALNSLVLASWLLAFIAPNGSVTRCIVLGTEAALAAVYAGHLLATSFQVPAPLNLGCGSGARLPALVDFFHAASPVQVEAAAHHAAAAGLLVGWIMARDAAARGVPKVVLAPCLFLTYAMGPLGLLGYLAARVDFQPARSSACGGGEKVGL